jgi:hypothetical protein
MSGERQQRREVEAYDEYYKKSESRQPQFQNHQTKQPDSTLHQNIYKHMNNSNSLQEFGSNLMGKQFNSTTNKDYGNHMSPDQLQEVLNKLKA